MRRRSGTRGGPGECTARANAHVPKSPPLSRCTAAERRAGGRRGRGGPGGGGACRRHGRRWTPPWLAAARSGSSWRALGAAPLHCLSPPLPLPLHRGRRRERGWRGLPGRPRARRCGLCPLPGHDCVRGCARRAAGCVRGGGMGGMCRFDHPDGRFLPLFFQFFLCDSILFGLFSVLLSSCCTTPACQSQLPMSDKCGTLHLHRRFSSWHGSAGEEGKVTGGSEGAGDG